MFLTFFSHFLSFQTNISSNPTKPKFIKTHILNTQQKKFIKSEINPKSKNNKTRTTHATTTTTRKSEIKESKRIGDEIDPEQVDRWFSGKISSLTNGFDEWCDDQWRMGLTISGFATIGDEWVWQFLGLRSEEWVRQCDLSLSLSLCVCAFESFLLSLSLSLSLSLGIARRTSSVLGFLGSSELLDVDQSCLRRCWGVDAISLPCCLSLSSIFLERKWFEVKMRMEVIFRPLSLILRSNWKHFQFDQIFSNSQTSTFSEKHFRNQFEAKTNGALVARFSILVALEYSWT